MVLNADEIAIDKPRIKGQADESIDDGRLGDDLERPRLDTYEHHQLFRRRVLTLLTLSYLNWIKSRSLVTTCYPRLPALEQLWQREPLARHLVPVVGVDELVAGHTVRRVPTESCARPSASSHTPSARTLSTNTWRACDSGSYLEGSGVHSPVGCVYRASKCFPGSEESSKCVLSLPVGGGPDEDAILTGYLQRVA